MDEEFLDSLEVESQFVARPPHQLDQYPFEFRWEFTRRNPYYLKLWHTIADDDGKMTLNSTAEPLSTKSLVRMALSKIGVEGQPIPPQTPFSQIVGDDPSFLCGSLKPITVRGIIAMLLGQVSPGVKLYISGNLWKFAEVELDETICDMEKVQRQLMILQELCEFSHPEFDAVSTTPLFVMNLDASQEMVKEDANRQAKLWKEKHNKSSPKIHTNKLQEYLAVWDRFEGWSDGKYLLNSEMSLKAIAVETKLSLSTIHDRYRRAFECIIGRAFSFNRWWISMGRMKASLVTNDTNPGTLKFMRRVPQTNRTKRASPIQTDHKIESGHSSESAAADFSVLLEDHPILARILNAIEVGKSDPEIIAECDLESARAQDMITYVRDKLESLKSMG